MHALVTLWDGGGTVPAEVGVARRLVEQGHTVTILGDPTLVDEALIVGAEFRPWTRAPHRKSSAREDDILQDWECRTPVQLVGRLTERMITGPAARYAADVREALADRHADVVVASGALLGALMGAESAGVPAVALSPNVYSRPAPGLPPFGSGLAPATGPLGRARDVALNALATKLWNRGLPTLNAARAQLGLEPLRDVFEQWDRADRVLVLTSSAFDLPAVLPANVRYVGPVLDDPAWAEPYVPPSGDEPLVVVGLSSTYMEQVGLLRRIVEVLGSLPVRGVVTTGPAVDPAEVTAEVQSPRVDVVRSAPHAQLFAHADLAITHAGHGTLLKVLAAGVPALCLPMGRDQRDNVVRAARHGAVIGLKPTASADKIADAVCRLLEDASYGANAGALAATIRDEIARSRLVEEIADAAHRVPAAG